MQICTLSRHGDTREYYVTLSRHGDTREYYVSSTKYQVPRTKYAGCLTIYGTYRVVQLSADLHTLRWSPRDFILLEEILDVVPLPEVGPPRLFGIFYGSFSTPRLLVLRMHQEGSRDDEAKEASAWLCGLNWLQGAGGMGLERSMLDYLLVVYKSIDAGGAVSSLRAALEQLFLHMHRQPTHARQLLLTLSNPLQPWPTLANPLQP